MPWALSGNIKGADGLDGDNGLSAFTETTTEFTSPAIGAQITVSVVEVGWIVLGQVVWIEAAVIVNTGEFRVDAIMGTQLTLTNLTAEPGDTYIATSKVSSGGEPGADGVIGVNACTNTAAAFDVPAVGATVDVTVDEGLWVVIGQIVWIEGAGEAGVAASFRVSDVVGNVLTLTNEALPVANTAAIPPGVMWDYDGDTAPTGWLVCDGTIYNIVDYPDLAAVCGTKHGGDGVLTFGVPDCRDRVALGASATKALGATGGAETHTLTEAELAVHSHGQATTQGCSTTGGGGYYFDTAGGTILGGTSTGGDGAHNNMKPYIAVNKIIKT